MVSGQKRCDSSFHLNILSFSSLIYATCSPAPPFFPLGEEQRLEQAVFTFARLHLKEIREMMGPNEKRNTNQVSAPFDEIKQICKVYDD